MIKSLQSKNRYEYRLSVAQAVCNPPGMFLYRALAMLALGVQSYRTFHLQAPQDADNIAVWLIVCAMLGTAMIGLFVGHTRCTSDVRWIEFTDDGMATNYGRLEAETQPTKANTINYKFLKTRKGLCGVTIIFSPSHHGEFVLVPWQVMSQSALDTKIQEGMELEEIQAT